MTTRVKIAQRAALMIIGTVLSVMGLIFTALGITLFPIIGILIAFPVMGLAFNCFRPTAWAIATESNTEPVMKLEAWDEESVAA
jgi:hypothetical protein